MKNSHHTNFENALCPCDSGKLSKNCCLAPDGTFRPKPCKIRINELKTGYAHLNCYASLLNDCSREISREHFIPLSILKMLSHNNKFGVRGFHWLQPGQSLLSPNALKSKILCRRHNNALAPLDQIAARLFRCWATVIYECGAIEPFRKPDNNSWVLSYSRRNSDRLFLFNGQDVERWLLKLLCGLIFSGNSTTNKIKRKDWRPEDKWLRILFGIEPFPDRWGLYLLSDSKDKPKAEFGLSLSPVYRYNDLVGLRVWINNIDFVMAMYEPDGDGKITLLSTEDKKSRQSIGYHPVQIDLYTGYRHRLFEFYWNQPGDGKNLHFRFDRPYRYIDPTVQHDEIKCNSINTNPTLRRNGPCPCGSGLKYKSCCGRKK